MLARTAFAMPLGAAPALFLRAFGESAWADHANDRVIEGVKCFTVESRSVVHGLRVGRSCPNTAPVDRITLIHVNPDLNSPGCFGSRAFFCRAAWYIRAGVM